MLKNTQSLNGLWRLYRDEENLGKKQGIEKQPLATEEKIPVPGSLAMLENLEGGVYWYETNFIPLGFEKGMRGFVNFGAVDFACEIFLNGKYAGYHEGRQCEFSIEVTNFLLENAENRLTVRVIHPLNKVVDDIDGQTILGCGGEGICHDVNFEVTGKTYIEHVQAYGNIHTSNIEFNLEVCGEISGKVKVEISDNKEGLLRSYTFFEKEITENKIFFEVPINNPLWWSVDTPNLYNVSVTIEDNEGKTSHYRSFRTAFREFLVNKNGEFQLNGKRVILKCAHGGIHTPQTVATDKTKVSLSKWYIIAMKAAGFNCIRYLQALLQKETLELCDELGMMVYQEHNSSWIPCGYPAVSANENRQTREQIFNGFYRDVTQRVKQDINHPSVVIWGLLNETIYCQRYEAAKEALPIVRAIDKTRLILLSSGSWGADLNGSVCNPFSTKWECLWGEEGTDHKSMQYFEDKDNRRYDLNETQTFIAGGYYTGSGDVHCYPTAQVTEGHFDWMEHLGNGKPVFLSEYGVGSQFDYPGLARYMENLPRTPENKFTYDLAHANDAILKKFIKEYELETLYPTPRDLIRDSYAEQNKYREQVFSMVRANPNIIGYSMTAVHDHGFAGEGFLSLVGEIKPGHMITMQEGWAPLRWCVLTYPTHLYNTEPIRLRVVLADEDVLKKGTYPVTLKIFNKDEIVWKKETSVTVKEGYRPYTHNVYDEVIVVPNLKEGEYTFCAELEEGALAQGGRVNFTVANRNNLPVLNKNVRLVGDIPLNAKALLENAGAKIVPLEEEDGIILVGVCNNKETWDKVYSYIEKGQKAVFMDRWSLTEEGKYYGFLDEEREAVNIRRNDGSKAYLVSNWEWLYHRMPIAKPHKLLGSLQARGILDQNYYNAVLSQQYIRCEKKADLSAVTAFAMNVVSSGGVGPILGSIVGKNFYGKGEYIFLTLDVLDNIGHPAADLVFLTLLNE